MKPPATVWVLVREDTGEPTFVDERKHVALGCRASYEELHRYRLDTPKPRKTKKRVRRG